MFFAEGIFVFALTAIVSAFLPMSMESQAPTLQSPRERFGSPFTPAVLPRPARPGAETSR